jgi:peptidoglycan/LPS O-acetylase OafA/YrhL
MPMVNNMIPVETFFMTSAFLRAYNLFKEYQNNRHDYISSVWKRYLSSIFFFF